MVCWHSQDGSDVDDISETSNDDPGLQILRMVAELFDRGDARRANVFNNVTDANEAETMDGNTNTEYSSFIDTTSNSDNSDTDSNEDQEGRQSIDGNTNGSQNTDMDELLPPLYEGSPMNRLGTILMLLNLCSIHGVNNNCQDELFSLLKIDILPRPNTLPESRYEACKVIKKLGLAYDTIHACEKGCVLFRKEHADATHCTKCNMSRYVDGSTTIPRKVLRHFPLIPRLKRMYRCSNIAGLMQWHSRNGSSDGLTRSVVDSKAWAHIDETWPEFATKPRNVRLGLALDGMNPYADLSTRHSTWPVMLINYNLPPWHVTKKFFVMLSLLIPGKESVKCHIDVYMEPLVEELELLWEGVLAYDVSRPQGLGSFTLRGLLMWTIHDYPAYGLISGCATKGYQGCPMCGPNVESRYSKTLRKNLFAGHRRYLRANHPYRRLRTWFNGMTELRNAPKRVTADEIIRRADSRTRWIAHGGKAGHTEYPVRRHGVKRKSILFRLTYWEVQGFKL